jgi:hypothetical protein
MRDFLRVSLLLPVVWLVACATGELPVSDSTSSSSASSGSGSGSGSGGSDLGPCGVDCSKFETPPCTIAVCNTGQALGQLDTCVVVPSPKGSPCDDGKFCTVNDSCSDGACNGGILNTCGFPADPCSSVICYEETKSCDTAPVNDGTECTPKDLCKVNGICHTGDCVGEAKDCTFSPLNECNTVACDPTTGECAGTPDPDKDAASCQLTGDLCTINKTCKTGQCIGNTPKNCDAFNVGCNVGVCDDTNGFCGPTPAPMGTTCSDGISDCSVGACDAKGVCKPSTGPNGVACNDHNACTKADTCTAGACAGAPLAGCSLYLHEGFEVCPNGWSFNGDWQCGTPANVGPLTAHSGTGCIATQIAGLYDVNQSFSTTVAESPAVDLTLATNPVVSFWAWDYTEGGTFDGWNLKVSINGGMTFTDVTAVTPAYSLTIAGKAAWGGNHSAEGWKTYSADLTAYAGHSIILGFAFRSDGATVYPGVYIDDVVISEPQESPLFITTPSPLMDVYAELGYSAAIVKTGGTSSSVWSINPGGVNAAWLSIDPTTGTLKGKPTAAELGPVSVSVHVEEPMLPSNFADKTFTFNVNPDLYYSGFEGACPDGWTLTGDWQCGVPTNVGPATAVGGIQCLGTQLASNYNDLQTYAGTTATSPDIDLTSAFTPLLTFKMWLDTEGSTYDGANLQISTDAGVTFTDVANVMPAYTLVVGGKPAWGGHQGALGWQAMSVDLTAYAGQIVRLRFAFRTDSSGTYAGVYLDDILVN